MTTKPGPLRPLARIALGLYSAALLTATHWPGLTTPKVVIDRTDLVIHTGAFCFWTILFHLARFTGTCPTRRLIWSGVAGITFATLDELTQPLPPFNRQFDLLDITFNTVGVILALILIYAGTRLWPRFRADLDGSAR